MKYKALEAFYNPLTQNYIKKGEIIEVNTDRANTFNRVCQEIKEAVKEEAIDVKVEVVLQKENKKKR